MSDLSNKIIVAYTEKFPGDFFIFDNIGQTISNYITEEKQKAALKMLDFALNYLKEKKNDIL